MNFANLVSSAHDTIKRTFGEEVTFEPLSGGSFVVLGIYNDRHTFVDPDTEQLVSSNIPTLGVKLADLTQAPSKGDVAVVRGKRYVVRDNREDGEGWLHLFLYEV